MLIGSKRYMQIYKLFLNTTFYLIFYSSAQKVGNFTPIFPMVAHLISSGGVGFSVLVV
jgi:hypothetical protein